MNLVFIRVVASYAVFSDEILHQLAQGESVGVLTALSGVKAIN